jgi:type IV pilus assembly protein PilM
MFRKKKHLIGLDIGSHTVKVIQVREEKKGLTLVNFGLAPVPPHSIQEGVIKEADMIAKVIRNLIANLNINEKYVATSVSGYAVMIKKIEVPAMSEEALEQSMFQELGQYIPYNTQEVHVDYQILGIAQDRPNNMEVLLVAAKKEAVDDYLNLINLAGLEAAVIDIDFFALSNAYEVIHGVSPNDTVALVDIGANKISINVVLAGVPVFTRDIALGGAQITTEIQNRFGLTYEQAERVKLGEGMERFGAHELEETFFNTAKGWSMEVKRALDFFHATYRETNINKILLSGGSCRLPGFDELVSRDTRLTVEVFNPLKMVDYDTKNLDVDYINYIGPQMAICLGLALRKADEK